jgi:hypothetical protein
MGVQTPPPGHEPPHQRSTGQKLLKAFVIVICVGIGILVVGFGLLFAACGGFSR